MNVFHYDEKKKKLEIHIKTDLNDEHLKILRLFSDGDKLPKSLSINQLFGSEMEKENSWVNDHLCYYELIKLGLLRECFDIVKQEQTISLSDMGKVLLKKLI